MRQIETFDSLRRKRRPPGQHGLIDAVDQTKVPSRSNKNDVFAGVSNTAATVACR
jgi:hypothetical protein